VAENPGGNQMNPLVLYGGTGVGKTHLLHSIGRYAITYKTAARVVCRTAEQFLKDFVKMSFAKADRLQVEREFRETYQNADMLLIDDVQVLAGKERSQEELFKLISRLMSHRKQVIFCCDRRPSEVPQLSERLLSRFDCGMSVSLHAPDVMTRISILRRKAACLHIPQEDCEAIFQWVATHHAGNVREIEGLITKLLAYHDLMGLDCNLETVKQLFGAMNKEKNEGVVSAVSIRSIMDATALSFGLAPALLSSQTRIQAVSLPRKIAMYLCREMTQESLKTIGFHFNRDYATVIASGKSIENRLAKDPSLQEKIQEIRLALQS
jgi:chromosomal replication initiator protein